MDTQERESLVLTFCARVVRLGASTLPAANPVRRRLEKLGDEGGLPMGVTDSETGDAKDVPGFGRP